MYYYYLVKKKYYDFEMISLVVQLIPELTEGRLTNRHNHLVKNSYTKEVCKNPFRA